MLLIPFINENEFEKLFHVTVCGIENANKKHYYVLNKGKITDFITEFRKFSEIKFDLSIEYNQHGKEGFIDKFFLFFGDNTISKIIHDNGDIQLSDLFRFQKGRCFYGLYVHKCLCAICSKARNKFAHKNIEYKVKLASVKFEPANPREKQVKQIDGNILHFFAKKEK